MMVAVDAADAAAKNAQELLNAAKLLAKQSRSALSTGSGRQRDVDDADAQVSVRQQATDTATTQRDKIATMLKQTESGAADPLSIECPENGVLRNVFALPGQAVAGGATLFEVVNLEAV